ncbi:MAG: MarR family transcriptional regulator [Euryarchaeota archaeon]|nr:MarR family transcriptional regulator [Euryarchaeota archaeon]
MRFSKDAAYIGTGLSILAVLVAGYFVIATRPSGSGMGVMFSMMKDMMGYCPTCDEYLTAQMRLYHLSLGAFVIVLALASGAIFYLWKGYFKERSAQQAPFQPQEAPREVGKGILELMPQDEQDILRPILESPGLAQYEIVSRSGYSKAKVSQVLSELEVRGLIYREREGKTYKVYPSKRALEELAMGSSTP